MVYYVPMGLFDRFRATQQENPVDVAAALSPYNAQQLVGGILFGTTTATREQYMAIPSAARARNIICSTVGSLPIEQYNHFTNEHIRPNRVIMQPDPRVAGSAIYSWIAEDLLLYGVAYGMVMDAYAATDASRIRAWTRIAPGRVFASLNGNSTEIEYYTVDGMQVPDTGVGSLVVFYGNDEGLLNRAGRTIRAGAELERAAAMYAREPVPSMVLKSNGTALPADRIAKLLDAWGAARRNRGTAFLNADITMETVGFTPEQIGLNAAREIIATELARAVGIPAYFIDAPTGSSMTYANASTARQTLLDFSLLPLMNSLSSRLSMPDFTPSTQRVEFDLKAYLRGSEKERAEIYKILFDIGAITTDEIRQMEDMIS